MNLKMEFLVNIALSNTQGSSFQRANVYAKDVIDSNKCLFVNDFRKQLKIIGNSYKKPLSDNEHIALIENFCSSLSLGHSKALNDGKIKFGVAQKAVNLYLKFLWCYGFLICEPPHCPIDRIVIEKIKENDCWTKLDSKERYYQLINIIRNKAKRSDLSIAEWELNLWNNFA